MKTRIIDRTMFYGAESETFRKAEILRKNMTLSEKILWKKLKNRDLFKVKFRRQHPVDIFIVDFYCHKFKLAIEIDGEIHFNNEIMKYDSERSAEIEKFGIRILRFNNHQVIFNIDIVLKKINKVITELTPLEGGRGTV